MNPWMIHSRLILCILTIIIEQKAPAEPAVKLVSFDIPRMVITKDKGAFVEILQEISQRTQVKVDLTIYPVKRAIAEFSNKSFDGIFPLVDGMLDEPVERTEPFFTKVDFAFVKRSSELVKSIKHMKGKRVGITLGYPYAKEVMEAKDFEIQTAPTDESNIKKLASGRIQIFVGEKLTVLHTARKLQLFDQITFDGTSPISALSATIAFHKSPRNDAVRVLFIQAIRSMRNDGTLEKILTRSPAD